jgi:hypothetical protein
METPLTRELVYDPDTDRVKTVTRKFLRAGVILQSEIDHGTPDELKANGRLDILRAATGYMEEITDKVLREIDPNKIPIDELPRRLALIPDGETVASLHKLDHRAGASICYINRLEEIIRNDRLATEGRGSDTAQPAE